IYSYSSFFSQANTLTQEQITKYKVKTQELERLMTLKGINPTKRLASSNIFLITCFCVITGKGTFNRSFLGLMALAHERAKGQDAELRAAFNVFDKEVEYVLMNASEPLNELEAAQMMEPDKD
uniref:Uncharacterized protein n=1 Tax=Salmo trutta TaxID=8032 RepID=A0A674AFR4_SALTR